MDLSDVTICIPTFERPECLRRLLTNIRLYYPDIQVVVVDSGKERPAGDIAGQFGVQRFEILPFHCGVSVARNRLLQLADTPLVFMCDDDMEFTRRTKLPLLLDLFQKTNCDLLAIAVWYQGRTLSTYCGRLVQKDTDLIRVGKPYESIHGVDIFDVVNNIFLADRKKVAAIGWDERLKTSELLDFFWRAKGKLRVGRTLAVGINHWQEGKDDYYQKLVRDSAAHYAVMAKRNLGFKRIYRNDKVLLDG